MFRLFVRGYLVDGSSVKAPDRMKPWVSKKRV